MTGMKNFDVVIAGGGVIGGAIALEVARAGLRVGVFDRQQPGKEASWASAGILSPAPENPAMIPLVSLGQASLQLYPEFVATVEEIADQRVGFREKGTLQGLFSKDARSELSTIVALHHGLGLRAEPLRAEDALDLEPALTDQIEAAVLRPNEASIDNRALTDAVLEAGKRSGVEIFSASNADAVWREGERCAGLIVRGEKVEARWTIVAAGCFSSSIEGISDYAPVRPAKGQMIALRGGNIKIERVLWSEHIYLVPRNDGRILAGATVEYAGFDKSITAGGIEKNFNGTRGLAPALAETRGGEMWAGLRPDSPDHLPIIGPTDIEGLVIATGHFRSGILLAPITAQLVREWITLQRVSVDWERFSPLRFAEMKKGITA